MIAEEIIYVQKALLRRQARRIAELEGQVAQSEALLRTAAAALREPMPQTEPTPTP